MLMRQGNQSTLEISIKRIIAFLNRKTQSKFKNEKGLKDARTIKKYLVALIVMNLIRVHDEIFDELEEEYNKLQQASSQEDYNELEKEFLVKKHKIATNYIKKLRADSELIISVNNCDDKEGFEIISTELFTDYVHKIGHVNWSIFCLLYKLHNINFGNQCGGQGFANPSRLYIADVLNLSERTVAEHIQNLPTALIKVEQQPCICILNAKTGKEEQKQESNHYIVYPKVDSSNKYYIDTTSKAQAS